MKNLICISFLIFVSNFVNAQDLKLSNNVKNELEILKKANLNLSDIQISRITHILQSDEEIVIRNKKTYNGNKVMLEEKLAEIKKYRINNILGAMTPLQAEKFVQQKLEDKL